MNKELLKKEIPPIIAIGCVIIPTMMGYDSFGLGHTGWLIVSALVAAFAMYCYDTKRAVLSIVCGLIMGITGFYATKWYFEGRESFFKLEVLIPVFIGLIPGGLIYLAGKALWKIKPSQTASASSSDDEEKPKQTDVVE